MPQEGADPGLAAQLDHTLLRADATAAEIDRLCDEAREHRFAAVCVNGVHAARCAARLAGSGVVVAVTVGFPLGAMAPAAKAQEARLAVADGAGELDVVIQIGALLGGDERLVLADLAGVCRAASAGGALVKAILETALLSDAQKIRACELAREAGAAFVKTSTGQAGGATRADVELLARYAGPALGVKAAGGIRTLADAREMLAAGASRIGTSSAVAIVGG